MLEKRYKKNISQEKLGSSPGKAFKNVGATYDLGKIGSAGAGSAGSAAAAPVWIQEVKGYFMRDPIVKSALWAKRALKISDIKRMGTKSALRFATAPTSLAARCMGMVVINI